jgi:hypothetical protein
MAAIQTSGSRRRARLACTAGAPLALVHTALAFHLRHDWSHREAPALNEVGTINPGTSRTSGTLDAARVCGYHDNNNETDPTFKGRIVVH